MGSGVLGTQHCRQAGSSTGLETTLLASRLPLQDVRAWARLGSVFSAARDAGLSYASPFLFPVRKGRRGFLHCSSGELHLPGGPSLTGQSEEAALFALATPPPTRSFKLGCLANIPH